MILIDPPSGWMYGFPREYAKKSDETLEDWLVGCGYPRKDAKWAAEHCRILNVRDEEP